MKPTLTWQEEELKSERGLKLSERCSAQVLLLRKELLFSERVLHRALRLLKRAMEDDNVRLRIQSRKARSIAAALVYIAGRLEDERITQLDIQRALDLTENAFRSNYQNLLRLLRIDLPEKDRSRSKASYHHT